MKEFNYKEVAKEIGWNFTAINPKVEQKKPYNYYKKVMENITPNTVMLDIGCGSGEKAIRYFSLAKKIYETDLEPEMLKRVKANIQKYYQADPRISKKFIVKQMDIEKDFTFADNTFDLVVARHSAGNFKEICRVLKKGGVFVSEDVSENDCIELKEIFGAGQDYPCKIPLYKQVLNECADLDFSEIQLLKFDQIEYYKNVEELKFLLEHTPILEGYEGDEKSYNLLLDKYIKKYSSPKGIHLYRRLYAFYLKK